MVNGSKPGIMPGPTQVEPWRRRMLRTLLYGQNVVLAILRNCDDKRKGQPCHPG